ncbi:MAG: NAD-dependent epimerase/dehydratase family protein [Flavobacteriaceae bacterium]|nr:NAD-dependent epimerase/dehydratase family protein [Flavobacteriaceae bacterium]
MILVTGGTGLVGAHLLYALINNDEKVRAIHRKSSDLEAVKNVFSYYTNEPDLLFNKIEWMVADITDVPSLAEVFKGIDYVYHCAAYISFNPRHLPVLKKVNVEGTANIVNFSLSEGVKKLCYISSIATLGNTTDGSSITEETEFNPEDKNSVYSITKHDAEMEVWRGTQEGLDAVIVHPGVILGEGIWSSASGGILRTVNKGVKYYTTGGVGIVDVQDVAKAMIALLKSTIKNDHFILAGENIGYREFLTKIAENLHKKPPIKSIAKGMMMAFASVDWFLNKLFKTKRKLLKATVRSLYNSRSYDASKIEKNLDFTFTPYQKTIERVCRNYLRDKK